MTNYAKNKNWSTWIGNTLTLFFVPIFYKVVVVKNKVFNLHRWILEVPNASYIQCH
jgi:hypothetical protein